MVLPPARVGGALAGSESAAASLVDPCEAQAQPIDDCAGARERAARAGARRPARRLEARFGRRRREPLPHLRDPARSLRFVGVSSVQLSAPDAFAAFAIAFWAGAVIPITGSGLGVVDAVLMTMLIESSTASDDALVAAALLWRVFYSGTDPAARRHHPRPFPQRGPGDWVDTEKACVRDPGGRFVTDPEPVSARSCDKRACVASSPSQHFFVRARVRGRVRVRTPPRPVRCIC